MDIPSQAAPTPRSGTAPFDELDHAMQRASARDKRCGPLLQALAKFEGTPAAPEAQKLEALLVACKEADGAAGGVGGIGPLSATTDPCASGSGVVCAYGSVYHVAWLDFSVSSTQYQVTVSTSGLLPLPGGGTPDTMLYVIRCDTSLCLSGPIVALNDDYGGTRASSVTFSPPGTSTYRAVVTSYAHGNEGYADITASANGTTLGSNTHQVFGGYHIANKELKSNDVLLAGENSDAADWSNDPDYHDSTLFVFSTSSHATCNNSACGSYQFNDDVHVGGNADTLTLSRLDVSMTASTARVVVGVYGQEKSANQPYRWNARLLHHRRHTSKGGGWIWSAQIDNDGDGLTYEIETALGSCDLVTDAPSDGVTVKGKSCQWFGNLVNAWANQTLSAGCSYPATGTDSNPDCWHLTDSDNDGLPDASEVWAHVVCCTQAPVSPYFDAGTCTPLPPDVAQTCGTSPYCATVDLSAFWDPDPATYDLYYQENAYRCTGSYCAEDHAGQAVPFSHAARAADQLPLLPSIWTTDPLQCWDGSTNYPCPGSSDLPYRAVMRLFSTGTIDLPDDSVMGPSNLGVTGTRSYFNVRFGTGTCPGGLSCAGLRHGRVARYAVASHYGAGQADRPGRTLIWGNPSGSAADAIISTFSHEAGHNLDLKHGQTDPNNAGKRCDPATDCTGSPACQCSSCADPSCPTAAAGINTTNPVAASVMNYDYATKAGMRPKSATPPGYGLGCFSGCSRANLRFSKGLNAPLDEASLVEKQVRTWQTIKLAQDLACFDDPVDCPYCSPYGWHGSACAPGEDCTPYCDAAFCYFNWNNATETTATWPPEPVYRFDLTHGRYNTNTCNQDTPTDSDEWLRIAAGGKRSLAPDSQGNFAVYRDPFNAVSAPTNIDPWGFTVSSAGLTVSSGRYERNICKIDSDCPSVDCIYDRCWVDGDCRAPAPPLGCQPGQPGQQGVCRCSTDEDCRSAWCIDGLCSTQRGACGCLSAAHCECIAGEPSCCLTADQACKESLGANVRPAADGDVRPRDSVEFGGPGTGDSLLLVNSGATSPFETIPAKGLFELAFDFRWDGGAASQVLWKSSAFEVSVVPDGLNARLYASLNGYALSFPAAASGELLDQHRWYRVNWVVNRNASQCGSMCEKQALRVIAWDLRTGRYQPTLPASGCVYKAYTATVPSFGDVYAGYDGATDGTRFKGRLDNVRLLNYVDADVFSGSPACVAE